MWSNTDANQQTRDGGAMNRFRLAALIVVGALSLGVLLVLILSVSGPPDAAQARAVDPSPAGSAGQGAAITPAASSGGPTLDSGEPETGVVLPAGETATPNASAAGDGNQFTPPGKDRIEVPQPGLDAQPNGGQGGGGGNIGGGCRRGRPGTPGRVGGGDHSPVGERGTVWSAS